MEVWIYLGTTALTIAWSVWLYLLWSDAARLPEESGLRTLFMVGPSLYFLLTAFTGWIPASELRLDLIGLLFLDGLTTLCAVFLLVSLGLQKKKIRRTYLFVLTAYTVLAFFLLFFLVVVRAYPPLLIRISSFLTRLAAVDIASLAWIVLNPEINDRDILGTLNRILVALFSYLPIMIIRFLYLHRQNRKMQKEIHLLHRRIDLLEKANKK